ncbi:MAG: trypsin-like peptidase domain-containing protein [Acidobacteria bacterium]|nr:trypsin-like peptidase domain-containing protein [Acidobacteriota bacterium]
MARFALALAIAAGALPAQTSPPPQKPPDALHELSATLQALSRRVSRAVVQVFSTGYVLSEDSESTNASLLAKQRSSGSGIILSVDGYIVTNAHVVQGARRVQVQLPMSREQAAQSQSLIKPAGRTVDARVVGIDRETDIAVLKIEKTALPHLTFGDSDGLRQGQLVMAFGNPLGLENSVSMGVVSSVGRQLRPDDPMVYIQTDASINPGNSGGPLVDANGRVIGINTFILTQSGGSEGIGFAVPSNIVRNVFNEIRRTGHVHRGQIGVYAQTLTPALAEGLGLAQDWGVLVGDVMPEGPAEKAGLQVGDIVLRLDGKVMENARQLEVNLYRRPIGEKVALEVLRGSEKLTLEVPVIEREDDPQRFADMVNPEDNLVPKLGILGIEIDRKIAEMLPDLRKEYGVVVAARAARSPYSGNGPQPGDVIYAINGVTTKSIAGLRSALANLKAGEPVVLQIERSGRLMFLALELE